MAHTPLRIVLDVLYVVLLVNCLHGIVGQERDLFEYEELTTQTVQPRASEHAFKKKEKGPRLPSSKPFLQVAQGRHMLFYIPGVKHCDLLAFQLWDSALEQWNDMGCSEADSIGWMWVFECVPDKLNKYRVYGKLNSRPILIGEIIALPDKPPTIVAHSVSAGPGWVSIWARLPEEDYPNVLGIKVRFTVEELKGDKWVAGPEPFNETSIYSNKRYFQRVQYSGDRAMLWPIHECPLWPKAKMFCMLFTDKFSYSENFTKEQRIDLSKLEGWGTAELPETPESVDNNKKIVFMLQTFRIPYYYPMSIHSNFYNIVMNKHNCNPMEDCPKLSGQLPSFDERDEELDEFLMGPMFDDDRPTAARKRPKRRPWPRETQLWVVFLVLSLFIVAVILPILVYFATRAGFRAADDMWTSWAEAPGNLIVGMGYSTVAWQGDRPAWKYERRQE